MSGPDRTRSAVLAAGKQAERERSPDAADAVHRDRADRIVNAQPFQQFNAQNHDHSGDSSEQDCAGRADPVAGAGDGDESGEEAIGGEAGVPFLARLCRPIDMAVRPAAQAARVVLAATRPMPSKSMRGKRAAGIESVPAEPQDQSAADGDGQIVRQHGSAAVTFELAAQARTENDGTGQRDESADGVHDRGAGESHGSPCPVTAKK